MSIILVGPTADGGYAPTDTVSLREIEQEIARRVGPFQLRWVKNASPGDQTSVTSTTTTIALPAIRSTIDLGGLEDMFVLRRGRLKDGTLLPTTLEDGTPVNFTADDRTRMVRTYNPQAGTLEVDRPYLYPTWDTEEVELHHLDPDEELRPVALAGLRRCYVVHRLGVSPVTPGTTIDLTEQAPWLLTRDQVYGVSAAGGAPLPGWRVDSYGGGLQLSLPACGLGTSYVVNRRSAANMVLPVLVNGNGPVDGDDWIVRTGNVNEPWDDEDRFAVPMDYAAAAGHIEAWRTARPRCSAVAQVGMWAEQKEAAAEFTRVATVYFDPPRYDANLSVAGYHRGDQPPSNAW